MDQVIVDRNSHHSNQVQDIPLTIEPIFSLIRTTDSYTSFSQELLEGKADIASLNLSRTISKYLNKLKKTKK